MTELATAIQMLLALAQLGQQIATSTRAVSDIIARMNAEGRDKMTDEEKAQIATAKKASFDALEAAIAKAKAEGR